MIRLRRGAAASGDDGLSMIEVMIYAALTLTVVGVLLGLFISTLRGQDTVTQYTDASARGQAVSQGLDRALRNASGVEVTTDGDGNSVLTVLTTLAVPCQLWRVTPAGELEGSTGPGAAATRSWGTLAENAEQIGGAPFFGWNGTRVRYSFALQANGSAIAFESAVQPRGLVGTVGSSCS